MKPLLICELGLHGGPDLKYYTKIVDQIVAEWSGWPPLAIKVQKWSPAGAWAARLKVEFGRLPLPCLDYQNLHILSHYCRERGLKFGCTAHDVESLSAIEAAQVDFVKLGARADAHTVGEVLRTSLPIISSSKLTVGTRATQLECVSAYPANMPWTYEGLGYSCHAVPSLAHEYVVKAAPRCSTIEVHVTARPKSVRPLPADMCVSMSVEEFIELAAKVGSIWSKNP